MLERLSLAKRMVLMLILPVLGLVVCAGLAVLERASLSTEMRKADLYARAGVAASRLTYDLVAERGLSAAVMLAPGDTQKAAEMRTQRAATDEAATAFGESVAALDAVEAPEELRRAVTGAQQHLLQLQGLRAMVDGHSADVSTVATSYNEGLTPLLDVVAEAARDSDEPGIKEQLIALDALAREIQHAGEERAVVNQALLASRFDLATLRLQEAEIASQQVYEETLLGFAPATVVQAYRSQVTGAHDQQLDALREKLVAAVGARSPAVSESEWWSAASSRLDAIAGMDAEFEHLIVARADDLRRAAVRGTVIYSAVAVVLVALAGLLAFVVSRGVNSSLDRASAEALEVSSQVTAAAQQLKASTSETASSVSETTTTLEEISQTARTAADKANELADVANQSRAASDEASDAAANGVEAMQRIRTEVESIAQSILQLSERNIRVGEIVQTVNAIAEKSNLLAVNASIEAAKAGEHGRGFAVVAAEVKALSEQSKEATEQIRTILTEVQKSSNGAVMTTEQGVKRVEEGGALIDELGRTIRSFAGILQESSETATQISLTTAQQQAGIEQITEAARAVEEATKENAASAVQLESTAEQVRDMSSRLRHIVIGTGLAK